MLGIKHFVRALPLSLACHGAQNSPCLARNQHCCVMVHVDDVMFCGDADYWVNIFLKKLQEKYPISHSQLQGVRSEIQFLKRTLKRVDTGLAPTPGA